MVIKQHPTLTLEQVLECKEHRANIQQMLRNKHSSSVVSITLNIPGPIKYKKEWLGMLYEAEEFLRTACLSRNMRLIEELMIHKEAGATFFMAIDGSAREVKLISVSIEENLCYGRLLDIDVLDASGEQINRAFLELPSRKCFVCNENAAVCVRTMRHSKEEVIEAAMKLIEVYKNKELNLNHDISEKPWRRIGRIALEAMLMEVAASPSPGLVDRFNSGAHSDMDIMTFLKSSSELSDSMADFAEAGWNHQGTLQELFEIVRDIGKKTEKRMFEATEGVNTQKGLLFLLGVLTAAAGFNARLPEKISARSIADTASRMCEGIVARELQSLRNNKPERKLTAGENFYLTLGFTGVRGEVEYGLPTVFLYGLPHLRTALDKGLSENDALIHSLVALMSNTNDTTILYRHNLEVLRRVQAEAKEILNVGGYITSEGRERIKQLDGEYSEERISPGGSADLLAVTWFLYKSEMVFSKSDY